MIAVKKIIFYLFVGLVLSSFFLDPTITFAMGVVGIWIGSTSNKFPVEAVKQLALPLLLLAVGLIFSFQNAPKDVFRDVFFFLNPIVIFLFGSICARYIPLIKLLRTFVYLGLVFAIIYIANHNFSSSYDSVANFREEEGNTSYVVVVSLGILLISIIKKLKLFRKNKTLFFIPILSAAFVIASSRTFLLVLIICVVSGLGYLRLNNKFILRGLGLFVVLAIGVSALVSIGNTDRKTFLGKLTTSLEEITIENKSSKQDINSNWRGYEGYRGVLQYQKGNIYEWIFGQGFGALTPLGITIKLGDQEFDTIPKFHNGYVHVLLKTGILGLAIYIVFFIKI